MPRTTTEEMKKGIFTITILLVVAIGFFGCRRHELDPNIETVDNQAILNYISLHGITGMKRDTVGGDTSGIYYQVILPGIAGTHYAYSDSLDFIFTLRSFDGNYTALDSNSVNHFENYAGHIASTAYPYGLQIIVHDVLARGGAIRVLIPSHLAYGVNGYGTGSTQVATNTRIAGNQCLDYYIHAINNRATYDDQVIKTFFTSNGISGYTRTADGLYYKLTAAANSTAVPITDNSNVTMTYTGFQLNGNIFDQFNTTDGTGTPFDVPDVVAGMREGLKLSGAGGQLSLYIPSPLGYGKNSFGSLPPNSIMHFEIAIISTNP